MPSVTTDTRVAMRPADVWDAVRDFGAPHVRLFPGILTDAHLDEADPNVRVVTFAKGLVVRETLVDVDDDRRRLAYAAIGGRLAHHNGSIQVYEVPGGSRIVWTVDFMPAEMAEQVRGLVTAGTTIMQRTLDAQ